MLLTALPRPDGTICQVIGLDAVREGGLLRVALLLCDGGTPERDATATLFQDEQTQEHMVIRLPELEDGAYRHMTLEVISLCP